MAHPQERVWSEDAAGQRRHDHHLGHGNEAHQVHHSSSAFGRIDETHNSADDSPARVMPPVRSPPSKKHPRLGRGSGLVETVQTFGGLLCRTDNSSGGTKTPPDAKHFSSAVSFVTVVMLVARSPEEFAGTRAGAL